MFGRLIGIGAVLLALNVTTATSASAQECGSTCVPCGFVGREGINMAWPIFGMRCENFVLGCTICGMTRVNSGASAETLLETVRVGNREAVERALTGNRDRLRVNVARGLVVLYGTKCDSNAVGAVIFVSPERARFIASKGVRPLADPTRQFAAR